MIISVSIVYVWVYAWLCVCIYSCVYIWLGVCTCVFMCTCAHECLVACYSDVDSFVRSELGNGRFGICVRCESDTLAIRRPTHELIRRSVPVHAVKIRWGFGSKTVSFHWVFVYWSISISIFYLNVSCACIYYSTLFCSCRSSLLHCDALILFYWYIITLLPTVLSIRSIILSRCVLVLILLINNNQMRIKL